MRKKIKLSFQALERELSQISSNQMLNILGGYMDPLPNGYCHFNMISAMLYGSNDRASNIRDEMYNLYGRTSFTDGTWTDSQGVNHTGQSYDPNLLDSYIRTQGFNAYNVEKPSLSTIRNGLDADGGRVGVAYQGHAWTVDRITDDGKVVLRDSTNTDNPTKSVDASLISYAYIMSSPDKDENNLGLTSTTEETITPTEDPSPFDNITTAHIGITTAHIGITTVYSSNY